MAEGKAWKIGKLVGGSTNTNTVPNATVTTIRTATLTKGLWMICAYGWYTSNFSARASFYILQGASSTIAQFDNTATYGGATSISCLLNVADTASVTFRVYQTSGSSKETHGNSYLNCVRVG